MCTRLITSSTVANQVGLVVLLYNSSKDVSGFLDSLVRANFLQEDDFLVFVDNSSSDDTLQELTENLKKHEGVLNCEIQILRLGENVGYAQGNNAGIKFLLDKCPWIAVVNPDIRFSEGASALKKATLDRKCLYAPEILEGDDGLAMQPRGRLGFREMVLEGLLIKYKRNNNLPHLPHGSFFALHSSVWRQTLFDEETFLYYEEDLLFEKLRVFLPKLTLTTLKDFKVLHVGGTSTMNTASVDLLRHRLQSYSHYVTTHPPLRNVILGKCLRLMAQTRFNIWVKLR